MNYYSHLCRSLSRSLSLYHALIVVSPDNYIRPLIDAARDTSHQSAIINLREREIARAELSRGPRRALRIIYGARNIAVRPSSVTQQSHFRTCWRVISTSFPRVNLFARAFSMVEQHGDVARRVDRNKESGLEACVCSEVSHYVHTVLSLGKGLAFSFRNHVSTLRLTWRMQIRRT